MLNTVFFFFNGSNISSHVIAYKKTSDESIPKTVWWRNTFFTFFSSYAKQFCFPSAHVSALALKCSIMFKCHKLKKRKHLPALECKMREILNWQSQIILFFFFFLQITITHSSMTATQTLWGCLLPTVIYQLIHSDLECNCKLRTTCLLGDPLPNVTLILNDNADVTLPMCECVKAN